MAFYAVVIKTLIFGVAATQIMTTGPFWISNGLMPNIIIPPLQVESIISQNKVGC